MQKVQHQFIVIAALAILSLSCNEEAMVDHGAGSRWKGIGLDNFAVSKVVLAEPYLYACTGPKGLYRKNIRSSTSWEYLGLADTSLAIYYQGVTDVDVKDSDIIVSFVGDYSNSATIGAWRSTDNGVSFFRSDYGIADPNFPFSYVTNVSRSPDNQSIGLAIHGGIFRTTNSGADWYASCSQEQACGRIYRPPGPFERLTWNSARHGEVWAYGYNPVVGSFMLRSSDAGISWQDLYSILGDTIASTIPSDLSFGIQDSGTIYVCLEPSLLKSTDNGVTWSFPLTRGGLYFSHLAVHPSIPNRLFLTDGRIVSSSKDGGHSITRLEDQINVAITSITVDGRGDALYAATLHGVYRYGGVSK